MVCGTEASRVSRSISISRVLAARGGVVLRLVLISIFFRDVLRFGVAFSYVRVSLLHIQQFSVDIRSGPAILPYSQSHSLVAERSREVARLGQSWEAFRRED
jgi:hypothetical protein